MDGKEIAMDIGGDSGSMAIDATVSNPLSDALTLMAASFSSCD